MTRDPEIERAIAMWRLMSRQRFGFARFYAPETFIEALARIGTLPWTRLPRLVSLTQVEPLRRLGEPGGPTLDVAVSLLRSARMTPHERDAADAVLRAPGHVPAPVRIEAAYLFAANGDPLRALAVLEARTPPPTPELLPPFWLPTTQPGPAGYVPRPPAVATEAPLSTTPPVSELAIDRLAWIGRPVGPSPEEVTALLQATRGTGQGVRALRLVLTTREWAPLPDPVRELCAELLVEQGDHALARTVLREAPPPALPPPAAPGIDVDAPLLESEAAARSAEAERVLAQDLDRLGVGERHSRFQAVARAAQLTVDAFRALGGPEKTEGLRDAARRLEDAGEPGRAAEVYALGGDLREASRLGVPSKDRALPDVEARALIEALDALDRRGYRLAAVEAARASLADHPDIEVAAFARGVLARLVPGPVVTFAIDGREQRFALGDSITLGRVGATLTVASPLVSRAHLRLYRRDGVAMIEDLASHNGTWLAGARLTAPLPIGDGLRLALGQEIPLSIQVEAGHEGVVIEVGGERTVAPLGPLLIGGLRIALSPCREGSVVTLQTEGDVAATFADAPVDTAIDLARGDVVSSPFGRTAPFELRVLG